MNVSFFILAGGYGTRALPLSGYRAKPAFPLLGVPLLTRLTRLLLEGDYPLEKGWVNSHHQPQSIIDCLKSGWPVTTVFETTLSGSRVLRQALHDPDWTHLLIANGDVYCEIPVALLLAAAEKGDGALLVRSFDNKRCYRTLECAKGRFLKRGPMIRSGLMFTGVCLLSRKGVESIRSDNFFDDFENKPLDLGICQYDGLWLDFGDPWLYYSANMICLDRFQRPENELWSPGSVVQVGPEEIIRTILWPGSVIGTGVRLENCIVCDGVKAPPGEYSDGIWTGKGFVPF